MNSLNNPTTYSIESPTITLENPTRRGYDFTGWKKSFAIESGSCGDKHFTAEWSATKYKIEYELNGGINHADNPDHYTIEDETITLQDPTREGYDFAGWDHGNIIEHGSAGVKIFTAKWKLQIYKITYSLDENAINSPNNPTTYSIESPTITLVDPKKHGYDFNGWKENFVIESGSCGDKHFTAEWSATIYDIEYELNGGENHISNPSTYTIESETIRLQDPTRKGYVFGGWLQNAEICNGSIGKQEFEAQWTLEYYDISYELNGGKNNKNNPSHYTIEDFIELSEPSRTGYSFIGWTPSNVIEKGSTGPKTFIAEWELEKYQIIYTLHEGINHIDNPGYYTIESETITLQDPTKTGYDFIGWEQGYIIEQGSTGVKIFTAIWELHIYNIKYILDRNAINSPNNPTTYSIESPKITLAAPSWTGYKFNGWDKVAVIERGSYGDREFTAEWDLLKYIIIYNLNGGTNHPNNPDEYTIKQGFTLGNPTKTGYTFLGWKDSNKIDVGSSGDRFFTATWKNNVYTFKYNANGGIGTMSPSSGA